MWLWLQPTSTTSSASSWYFNYQALNHKHTHMRRWIKEISFLSRKTSCRFVIFLFATSQLFSLPCCRRRHENKKMLMFLFSFDVLRNLHAQSFQKGITLRINLVMLFLSVNYFFFRNFCSVAEGQQMFSYTTKTLQNLWKKSHWKWANKEMKKINVFLLILFPSLRFLW